LRGWVRTQNFEYHPAAQRECSWDMMFLANSRVWGGVDFLGSTKFPMVLHCEQLAKLKLKTNGPSFVPIVNCKITLTADDSTAWCVVVIMRSVTYWHDGGGPGGLLDIFPQCLGRHCGRGTRNALIHTWPHYFPQHNTR
jgi:hypothetical protein